MNNRLRSIHGRKKRKVLIWCVTSLTFFAGCASEPKGVETLASNFQVIQGETQGTTYGIKLVESPVEIKKSEIDSVLRAFDLSLSGYIPESFISQLNKAETSAKIPSEDTFFLPCLAVSEKIAKLTDGSFDPTVLPLMQLWGFLKDTENVPTQVQIDSTLSFIGFNNSALWSLSTTSEGSIFNKQDPRLRLDFNAIAQGYSVDVIGDFLRKKGCLNFYVEIGGEILVSGNNPEGEKWRIGVDKPVAANDGKGARVISAVVTLKDKAIATSGNYRKFYKKNGKIYAHTLDPKSGRPAENELLSVTVVAENAAEADGLATAFMVMGLKKSKEFLSKHSEYDALFIFAEEGVELQSYASPGMEKMLE